MYKDKWTLNNPQWLICHKLNQTKSNQSEPWRYGNKEYSLLLRDPKLEPHHHIHISVIARTPLF